MDDYNEILEHIDSALKDIDEQVKLLIDITKTLYELKMEIQKGGEK